MENAAHLALQRLVDELMLLHPRFTAERLRDHRRGVVVAVTREILDCYLGVRNRLLDHRFDIPRFHRHQSASQIRHIPESQTQRLQLEQNDIDVGYTLSSADFEGLAKNPDVEIVKVPGGGFYYFGVSMKDPDLGKKEVRQALDYCIDYDGINKGIMTNYGIPWHNHVLQGLAGELPNTKHTFDVERCKADLAAAGYPNGMKKNPKVLRVPPFREIATLIEQALAENDNDKRRDMYVKIQELTAENVSWMYLISQRIDPFAIHKRVKNYDASATWRPRWQLGEKS